ncbi:MAG TPA: glycosyltransferase family 4 protein [Ktedonobacteraceae bacterium]|nr:glycosyltransferase family 4 protein [Ktedonobacteraceae bacterium]
MSYILFITPYYPPEKGAAAVRISETAVRLVRQGHSVTILTTFPNYPTGIVPLAYRGHRMKIEWLDGVRIVRVWSYTSANKGFLRRIFAQLSFGCLAPLLGWSHIGHPDIIIAQSPPLFDAIAARMLSRFKRIPFIFMVSDLWPESAVQLGALRNTLFIRLSQWLEKTTYQRASAIWAMTEGIRKTLLQEGLAPDKVFFLPNGVDTKRFRPLARESDRNQLFIVLYVGTFGLSHGLMTVLDAAEELRDCQNVRFILAGDGAEKEQLVAEAGRRQLANVTFLDAQPHERVPSLLAGADACLVPLRKLPLFEGALPIKMFEAMACGRPILLAVDGEARRLAEQEAGAAIYVEPENPRALVGAIKTLREHPDVAEAMGKRGRAFVEAHFDRDMLTQMLEARITAMLGKQSIASAVVQASPIWPARYTESEEVGEYVKR